MLLKSIRYVFSKYKLLAIGLVSLSYYAHGVMIITPWFFVANAVAAEFIFLCLALFCALPAYDKDRCKNLNCTMPNATQDNPKILSALSEENTLHSSLPQQRARSAWHQCRSTQHT